MKNNSNDWKRHIVSHTNLPIAIRHQLSRSTSIFELCSTEVGMEPAHVQPAPSPTLLVPWKALPNTCRLKLWSHELQQACAHPFDAKTWDMAGHAVLIEATDAILVRDMLHQVAGAAGMALHLINPIHLGENLSTWLKALPPHAPAMVYLEPGGWQCEPDDASDAAPAAEATPEALAREQLRLFLSEQAPNQTIVVVSTAPSFNQLALSLRQVGLFDRRIRFPEWTPEAHAQWFLADMAGETLAPSLTTDHRKLGALLRHEYPDSRRRALMQKAMRRVAWREQRPLEFFDLVRFAAYGTCEVDPLTDDSPALHRHAVHEAGHALIAHVDSRHQTPPSYCCVLKHIESHGMVIPAFDSHECMSDDLSHTDMCHKIRVMLGGRAAEHLLLGASQVSAEGAASDLENATRLASSMLGSWGQSHDISSDAAASANLAVAMNDVSASEALHIEQLVRQFLQQQFLKTLEILRTHNVYLQNIVTALTEKGVLLQDDFIALRNSTELGSATPLSHFLRGCSR